MGTVETRSKTPAEGSSPSPEKAKPRTSEQEGDLKEALKGGKDSSEVSVSENGAGFSMNGNEGLSDDAGVVEVVKSRVVETRVSVQRDFGGRDIAISARNDCHGLADSEMNGVSSLLKMRESGRSVIFSYVGGSQTDDRVGSVYGSVKKPASADGSCEGGSVRVDEEEGNNSIKSEGKEDDEDSAGKVVTIDVPIAETSENENKGGEIEDIGEEGYGFSVGDFVWGKIRSHPWWPGRIYNSSDASESAVKLKQKNRLLVAYFGDGTFAWCHPSQLKPFEENFEDMVKHSSSRTFFNAVQEAVNEVGKLLDLKMTSSCVTSESRTKLAPPLVRNSGIKEGVLVPEIGMEKFSTMLIDPTEILSRVKQIAKIITPTSVLELEILKARLLAFYLLRGGYKLASYQPPQPIPGLEDNEVDEAEHELAVEAPVQGPFEDDFSSPLSPRFGETGHSTGNPANKSSHRRKQKSIAEIMGEDNDFHDKNKNDNISVEGVNIGKSTVSSGRKKRKSSNDTVMPKPVQKKEGLFQNTDSAENDIDKAHSSGSNKEADENRGEAKEQLEKGSLPRERKKSKYLSPPFTTSGSGQRKKDMDIESPTASNEPRSSERMKVTGQLLGSPPILKCSSEAFPQNLSNKPVQEGELYDRPNSQTQGDENERIDTTKLQVPAGEVRSELSSLALSPHMPRDMDPLEKIVGFVLVFRNSLYREGSYYKVFNKRQPGRKRKKPESDLGLSTEDQNQTDHDSEQKKKRRNIEPTPDMRKPKRAVDAEKGKKGTDESAPAAAIFASFGPGSTLPSKTDIVTLYSKFGPLNEAETDMFYNNYTARVSFLSSSDAEKAFHQSQNLNPFGPNSVSFRLQYLPSGSKPSEHTEKSQSKASPAKKKDKTVAKTSSQTQGSEASKLNFIKQKLEALTSMLEASDGKWPETKTKLETEMKGLLNDVSKMVESSSF